MSVNDFLIEKLIENLSFEPTGCQRKLFDKLARFIGDETDNSIFIINGYAGTGKTSAIASLIKVLTGFSRKFFLMAPTGRAAKVLSGYTGKRATTIHKQIYRQKSIKDGVGYFSLDINKNRDSFFIVDEASLISASFGDSGIFGSGRVLEDLVEYVKSGKGNKLILIGDSAQLPPVGETISNALDMDYMKMFGEVDYAVLRDVVRQEKLSGVLHNATIIREMIESGISDNLKLTADGFDDVEFISGADLIEKLNDAYSSWGYEETQVLCRSNKRANRYNHGIRSSILYRDERISRGDRLMVVKNCYQFLEDIEELDFIANGDVAELVNITGYEERYGLTFANATLSFMDYNFVEVDAKIILDTLESEKASLSSDQSRALYEGVMEDYSHLATKRKRTKAVREDKYYNALQIKHANAITCHKSQGGQWKTIFIDNPFWKPDLEIEDLKWLYTAITRAVDKVYFINFDKRFLV